jgi:hypothetical protein
MRGLSLFRLRVYQYLYAGMSECPTQFFCRYSTQGQSEAENAENRTE